MRRKTRKSFIFWIWSFLEKNNWKNKFFKISNKTNSFKKNKASSFQISNSDKINDSNRSANTNQDSFEHLHFNIYAHYHSHFLGIRHLESFYETYNHFELCNNGTTNKKNLNFETTLIYRLQSLSFDKSIQKSCLLNFDCFSYYNIVSQLDESCHNMKFYTDSFIANMWMCQWS